MQDEEFLGQHELISELTNRSYWSRVWVIQKFFLARDVEIWYGKSVLAIDHFQDLVLEHSGVHLSDIEHMDYTPSKSPHRAWPFVTNRNLSRYPDFALPLWRLLIDQRYSMCKDPRDKVFAFLGLLPKDEKDLLGRFFPNYDISEDHVIIITLVHLQEYSLDCPKITLNSDDIFLGLGVDDKSRRRKLLRQAADIEFDYFDTLTGNPLHT